jgi:hypothetical protein
VAGLAGRTVPVLPAKALLTSRTNRAGHRTVSCLAAEFVHDLTPLLPVSFTSLTDGESTVICLLAAFVLFLTHGRISFLCGYNDF